MSKARKPDFICIGPEKTGTSWLYKMLIQHPEIWLPPVKELRFLNEGNLIPDHTVRRVILSSHWHYKSLRRRVLNNTLRLLAIHNLNTDKLRRFQWEMKYCLGRRSFDWYSSLFPDIDNKLCGDISPHYYDIPESRINELYNHNKDIKVLIFIRNPIERVWSKALMNLCRHKGRNFEDISHSEFLMFFSEVHNKWTPYLETIGLWEKYFSDVFIGFYDTLSKEPSLFLAEICDFLGINKNIPNIGIGERVNKGIGKNIPSDLAMYLRNQYLDEIKAMAVSGYSKYPKLWLEAEY